MRKNLGETLPDSISSRKTDSNGLFILRGKLLSSEVSYLLHSKPWISTCICFPMTYLIPQHIYNIINDNKTRVYVPQL